MTQIAIDFDGTCVTHAYPNVGREIGAAPWLKRLTKDGHQLILFTMRGGKYLDAAVRWFNAHEIPLYGINVNPTQHLWTNSPKAYAEIYVDDAAVCTPLVRPVGKRPYIDWDRMGPAIYDRLAGDE